MGNRKQKWKSEEEAALRAGIAKYGHGKWKLIHEDPEFHQYLSTRSNVDLKDKWRNLYKDRVRTSKTKADEDAPSNPSIISQSPAVLHVPVPVPVPAIHQSPADHVKDDSANNLPHAKNDAKTGPRYNELIFEALSAVDEQLGLDISSIVVYIEQRMEVPQNFRKRLGERLRKLVQQGKVNKVDGLFFLTNKFIQANPSNQKDGVSRQCSTTGYLNPDELLEEAAKTAAYKVCEAETVSYVAADCVKEAERISKMAEETDSILQLAKVIFERCARGEILLVA